MSGEMHRYTIHHDDKQQGPFTADELVAKLNVGEVLTDTLTWRPGLAEWGELATVLRKDGALPPEAPGVLPPPLTAGAPAAFSASEMPPCPNNWLVPSIFSTLCCCLPFGIVAIVYAAQVNGKHRSGDYEGARKAADNAKLWTLIALGIGLICAVVQVVSTSARI